MKKHILFILFFCLPFVTVAQDIGNRDNPYWTEIVTSQPEGYVVLENGDVEISSAEGLAWLISVVNGLNGCEPDDFDGKKVELINDVDLSEGEWTPIGDAMTNPIHAFKGVFIGNRKAINNLYIHDKTYSKQYLGIFGYLDHAEVHDVFLYNGLIWGGKYCAGIVGWSDNGTLIDNCVVNLSVGADFYLGGIVGLNRNSIIRNCCYIHDSFMAWDTYSGGIAGRNEAEGQNAIVENCYFDSKIDGTLNTCYPGGVVGLNNTTGIEGNAIVKNCYAALRGGIWNGEGGIVGRNQLGEVSKCYFTLIDDYNNGDDISVIGDGDMNFSDCSVFTYHDGVGCMLENPVSIGENTTSDLLEALNLWLTIQDPIIQYNNWCEGETLPVFCNQNTGINETLPIVDTFVIYPNPTTGQFTVEGANVAKVEVYNLVGQKVHEAEGQVVSIDAAEWNKGIYLVNIIEQNGAVATKKLVVR